MSLKVNKIDFSIAAEVKQKLDDYLKATGNKLEMGFFEEAVYSNGIHAASVGKWMEFGTLKIPMRPFLRPAVDKNIKRWTAFLHSQLKGGADVELSLNRTGELARGDIVKSLTSVTSPPLAEATIKRKGSDKPLIDTGFLRASIDYKVR